MREPELQLVVFRLGEQRYAVDLQVVDRVAPMVAIAPLHDGPPIALGVINVHGQVIPVVDARQRLGLAPASCDVTAHLLLARTSRRTLAIPVDEVVGVIRSRREAMVAADEVLPHIRNVRGVIPLAEDMVFVHDLEALLSLDDEAQLADALSQVGANAPA
jgi:purine-binding chemotaxis protein CheW